jgi:hypothetical protein
MEEEKKTIDEISESETVETGSDDSRREFLTKLATAAGAVVAASLLTGSEADAQIGNVKLAPNALAGAQLRNLGSASVSSARTNNGLSMRLTNKQIVQSIARESLGMNVPGAESMDLTLSYS